MHDLDTLCITRRSMQLLADDFVDEFVELAVLSVGLYLCVPGLPVTLDDPFAQFLELTRGKFLNLLLNMFNLTQDEASLRSIPPSPAKQISSANGRA